jgi:hypothetical protein
LKRANLRRKWSTILKAASAQKQQHFNNQPSRLTAWRLFVSRAQRSPLFELARVGHDQPGIVIQNAQRRKF